MLKTISLFTIYTLVIFLYGCDVNDKEIQVERERGEFVYFMVTHGPTTDVGFWGEVFSETQAMATQLNVNVVALHPVIETSGDLLNEQMQQAINAQPPGIIATIWGDGMPEIVKQANAHGIPIAAINVYPDPEFFGVGKAEFLFYSGQNDVLAAVDVTLGLICSAVGQRMENGSCENAQPQDILDHLTATQQVRAVCIIHQQSAGVLSRCESMRKTLVEDMNLPASSYSAITWDEATPGAGIVAISTYFDDPSIADVDLFLVMATGNNGIEPFLAAELSAGIKSKIKLVSFDTTEVICNALFSGDIIFASGQGHREQGKKALELLHFYVTQGFLPEAGIDVNGEIDNNWIISPDGYPWYKTGPVLFYGACP